MGKGYWIVSLDVSDPIRYRSYVEIMDPVIAAFGGRFLVRVGEYLQVEGNSRSRQVVIEFDTYEIALTCYDSPEYRVARTVREEASTANFLIVRGVD